MRAIYMSKLTSTLLERDSGATSRFSPFQQPHLMLLTPGETGFISGDTGFVLQLLKTFEILTVGSR